LVDPTEEFEELVEETWLVDYIRGVLASYGMFGWQPQPSWLRKTPRG
jgi:hypothetical protein